MVTEPERDKRSPLDTTDESPEEAKAAEEQAARALAARCRLQYIDLEHFEPDHELFKSVPVELMFRYNFLPYRHENDNLVVVTSDPTNVPVLDELSLLLNTPIQATVGTESAIQELLKRSQSAQRVLEEASESFSMQIIRDEDEGEETLSIDRLTDTSSPIIRLVDSAIYNALNKRASDIHVETRD
jgi:type IV pilus assembly protein PilB